MRIDRSDTKIFSEILHRGGKKIVFTNGCFDILHAGHVRYLKAARSLGDVLILGLNSDQSVKKLKGEDRPINSEDDRLEVIDALEYVDFVVIFDESTAENLVSEIKPDIYVKGGDYSIENLPEGQIVLSYGGKVELIPLVAGRSTTNIIRKIGESR
ncbi:MAG: D-glycero-beta-D-manno-heptose 1-phosphate adenylyltransferase [Selenomonadaceae bacterium]|nr:D-glycero-beta-D-manno-heptose 1-phosphate adenylyltransferase [Selenomonadaceae bacterium]